MLNFFFFLKKNLVWNPKSYNDYTIKIRKKNQIDSFNKIMVLDVGGQSMQVSVLKHKEQIFKG